MAIKYVIYPDIKLVYLMLYKSTDENLIFVHINNFFRII